MRNRVNLLCAMVWFHLAMMDMVLSQMKVIELSPWLLAFQFTLAVVYGSMAYKAARKVDLADKAIKEEMENNNGQAN